MKRKRAVLETQAVDDKARSHDSDSEGGNSSDVSLNDGAQNNEGDSEDEGIIGLFRARAGPQFPIPNNLTIDDE